MVRAGTGFAVTPGSQLTVTVGAGGTGGTGATVTGDTDGAAGGVSVFGSITSLGGGGGGRSLNDRSGTGGAVGDLDSLTAPSGGKGGRNNAGTIRGGGGGGSMEEPGYSAESTGGALGAIGTYSAISGTNRSYGDGGTGGSALTGSGPTNGSSAPANTGRGGNGGSAKSNSGATGGNGGSGIVIIKYAVPSRLYVGGSFDSPFNRAFYVDLKTSLSNSHQLGATPLGNANSEDRVTSIVVDATAKKAYLGCTDALSLREGENASALMAFDESTSTLSPDTRFEDTAVRSLALSEDSLFVSGHFTALGALSCSKIVRMALTDEALYAMGTAGLSSESESYASSMVVVPSRITANAGKLVLGGNFENADGVPGTGRIALWNPDTNQFESVGLADETLSENVTSLMIGFNNKLWVAQTSPAPALARSTMSIVGLTAYSDIGVRVQKLIPDSATALGPVQCLVGDYVALFVVFSDASARLYVHELPSTPNADTYADFVSSTLLDGIFGSSSLRLEWIPRSALPGGFSVTHGLLLAQSVNETGQSVCRLYIWNHTTKTLDHLQDLYRSIDPSDSLHVMQPVDFAARNLGFVSVSQPLGQIRVWGSDVAGNVYEPMFV